MTSRRLLGLLRMVNMPMPLSHAAKPCVRFHGITHYPYTTLKRARKDLANLKETVTSLQCGQHRDLVFGSSDSTGHVQ